MFKKFKQQFHWRASLDLLIEINYLAIVFLIPLWFAYLFPTYGVFEFNKMVVFQCLVWGLLGLTIIKAIFLGALQPSIFRAGLIRGGKFFKNYGLWPTILVVGLASALFFSINPQQSFWGSYVRQQGCLSFFFYFLWFGLLIINILTIKNNFVVSKSASQLNEDSLDKRIGRIIKTMVISGGLVAGYAILQSLGIDFLTWSEPAWLTHRAFSTLGQPNFLASFLLLIIPFSFYLSYFSRRFFNRCFYALIGVSQILALFLTGSRGGEIAFFSGLFLGLIYFLIFQLKCWRRRLIIMMLGLIIIILGVSATVYFSPERFRDVFNSHSGSTAARVIFYQAAAQAILEKPIFGYGLENSQEVLIHYYEPEWGIYNQVGVGTDRVHSLLLDIILTSGLWGLALYTAFYYWFFQLVWQNIRRAPTRRLALPIFWGTVTYSLSLFFNFSLVAGEVYWWLLMALLVCLDYTTSSIQTDINHVTLTLPPTRLKSWPQQNIINALGVSIFILGLIAWGISRNIGNLVADYYFNKLTNYTHAQEIGQSLVLANYIRQLPLPASQQDFYDRYFGHYLVTISNQITELALAKLVGDEQELIFNSLSDSGYENLLVKAEIAGSLGEIDVAKTYFLAVHQLSPSWPIAYLFEAKFLFQQQDSVAARQAYLLVNQNLPDLDNPFINAEHRQTVASYKRQIYEGTGDTYWQEQQYQLAGRYYQTAYRYDTQAWDLLQKVADSYYQLGDFTTALAYNQRIFERDPTNYLWPLRISLIYQLQGELNKASYYQAISDNLLSLMP